MSGLLFDRRRLPVFIHSELDDMGLSLEAFRVYAHLARRAGRDGRAWPGLQSIGDVCFWQDKHPDTRRKKATAAVAELEQHGLIAKHMRHDDQGRQLSNNYDLLPVASMDGGAVGAGGEDDTVPPGGTYTSPKDSPVEDTPISSSSKSRKRKQKGSSESAGDKLDVAMRDVLLPVMYGHSDLRMVMPQQWGNIKQVATKLQQAGITPKQVQDWHAAVWKKAWPGTTRSPYPGEIVSGLAQRAVKPPPATYKLVVTSVPEREEDL